MSNIINDVARILRAGDGFSDVNQKLRRAVWELIEWFNEKVGEYSVPEEIGWVFRRNNNSQCMVSFLHSGGWHEIIANKSNIRGTDLPNILLFCQAIDGEEGQKLIAWLEEQTRDRENHLSSLQILSANRA